MDMYVILDIDNKKASLLKIFGNKIEESLEYSYDSSINKNILDAFIGNLKVVTYDHEKIYDTIIIRNVIKDILPNLDSYELEDVASFLGYHGNRVQLIFKIYKYILIKEYLKNNKDTTVSLLQRKFLIGIKEANRLLKGV